MSVSQARQAAKQALVQMAAGINPNKAKAEKRVRGITLTDAIDQVLSEKSSVLKKTTIEDYRKVLLRHFSDWGNRPIGQITTQDVTKRYTHIREGIKKRSRVAKVTTNPTGEADAQKAMRYLSAIFSHFETDYAGELPVLPQGNVVKVLAKKRIRPPIKRRERTLNLSERLALIDVLWGEEAGKINGSQRDWVLLLMLTGLRYHEPLSLRWENIDWSLKVFTITETKNGEHLTLPMTKLMEMFGDGMTMRLDNSLLAQLDSGQPFLAGKINRGSVYLMGSDVGVQGKLTSVNDDVITVYDALCDVGFGG